MAPGELTINHLYGINIAAMQYQYVLISSDINIAADTILIDISSCMMHGTVIGTVVDTPLID